MRSLALIAALLPMPSWAETFVLDSSAAAAVMYPQGGTVSHIAILNAPAGMHQIILPDLPKDIDLDALRIAAPGVLLSGMRLEDRVEIAGRSEETPAVQEARGKIDATKQQIAAQQERVARARLRIEAANATLEFLTNISKPKDLTGEAENLRAIAQMIGQESETAKIAIRDAVAEADTARTERRRLEKELERLQATLTELMPLTLDGPHLVLSVTLNEPAENLPLKISFMSDEIGWEPSYTLRLFEDEVTGAADLRIERHAMLYQATGEDWSDIQLTLSTQRPNLRLDPPALPPLRRSIREDVPPQVYARSLEIVEEMALADPMMKAPALLDAGPIREGLSVSYRIPQPVDLKSNEDPDFPEQIEIGTLTQNAEVIARAIPRHEKTAYLIAKFRNEGIEPLLPSQYVQRYFNGSFVGTGYLPEIPAGAQAEMGFGQISGLRLTRKVLDKETGDQGILTRSNVETENVQITIENLDTRPWSVELRARVPYSEQEDLEVTYSAQPRPDVVDLDDERGILQWNLELDPGATRFFGTKVTLTWPEGFVLD